MESPHVRHLALGSVWVTTDTQVVCYDTLCFHLSWNTEQAQVWWIFGSRVCYWDVKKKKKRQCEPHPPLSLLFHTNGLHWATPPPMNCLTVEQQSEQFLTSGKVLQRVSHGRCTCWTLIKTRFLTFIMWTSLCRNPAAAVCTRTMNNAVLTLTTTSSPTPLARRHLRRTPTWHFALSLSGRGSVSLLNDNIKKNEEKCVCYCEQHTGLLTPWDKGCQQQHFNFLIV